MHTQFAMVVFCQRNVCTPSMVSKSTPTPVCYTQLTTDRSVTVRTETTAMLSDWLTSLPDRYKYAKCLVPRNVPDKWVLLLLIN